ncbi:MAG TPA: hypothetical protein VIJ59_08720 [Caulobacteraceae bacterium]
MNAAAPVRHGPLLASNPWARLLPALALGLVALVGALALIVDAARYRDARDLASRLSGAETVVVWSHGLESADAAAARAGEILAAAPGVVSVTPLDPRVGDDQVARALGAPAESAAGARLLAIEARGGGKALAESLGRMLSAQGLPARVRDHAGNGSGGLRMAGRAAVLGVLAPLVALVAFALVCAGEAGGEIGRGRGAVELLLTSGAADGYVARLVRRRVGALALTAALWGLGGAMIAAALASRAGLAGALGGPARGDLLTPWPLIVPVLWVAGLIGAWFGARSRLKSTL